VIKPFLSFLFINACLLVQAAEPLWLESFDTPSAPTLAPMLTEAAGRGRVLHLAVPEGTANPGRTVSLPLPVAKLRGQQLVLGVDAKIAAISRKPNAWNGVKVMLVIETPAGRSYPQPEIPEGTADWRSYTTRIVVPEAATNLSLVLGLEQVTGEAWFDNVRLSPSPRFRSTYQPNPAQPVFRGHQLPRLRGAMAGTDLNEEDIKHFATVWKGNLLRFQIFEAARKDRELADYDVWLAERLKVLDRQLEWCERYRVKAVVDLHSPPGGEAFSAGYITARGRIFTQPAAQAKFVQVWEHLARRYLGRRVIWGFDLLNEPDDSMVSEDCLDWNGLADKAARAVRVIDPERTLIIEPNQWGGAGGFTAFEPLDLPGVVYSFHFYHPMAFTHQGIQQNPAGVTYPGTIGNERWDPGALTRAMQPALDFARKHRVHLYVGEFSAIRIAPGDSAAKYLADLIDLFEQNGFDWSYHAYREWQGWSLEHEGPLSHPAKAQSPTVRQKVVTGWFSRNQVP
jgi:hypothetical protein